MAVGRTHWTRRERRWATRPRQLLDWSAGGEEGRSTGSGGCVSELSVQNCSGVVDREGRLKDKLGVEPWGGAIHWAGDVEDSVSPLPKIQPKGDPHTVPPALPREVDIRPHPMDAPSQMPALPCILSKPGPVLKMDCTLQTPYAQFSFVILISNYSGWFPALACAVILVPADTRCFPHSSSLLCQRLRDFSQPGGGVGAGIQGGEPGSTWVPRCLLREDPDPRGRGWGWRGQQVGAQGLAQMGGGFLKMLSKGPWPPMGTAGFLTYPSPHRHPPRPLPRGLMPPPPPTKLPAHTSYSNRPSCLEDNSQGRSSALCLGRSPPNLPKVLLFAPCLLSGRASGMSSLCGPLGTSWNLPCRSDDTFPQEQETTCLCFFGCCTCSGRDRVWWPPPYTR